MTSEEPGQIEERSWEEFHKWSKGRDPRPLFVETVAKFDAKSGDARRLQAVDLGCGDGTETFALLDAGWEVLAIDSVPTAIASIQSKVPDDLQLQLETGIAAFEDLELSEADLVYAGYSLPFCRPEHFDRLWATIVACIRPDGRFAGQLFGPRDSWADRPEMTFHSSQQVESMLAVSFDIEALEEIDEDGEAMSGPKHWHVFDIMARRLDY
jgi:trans-aconitate methyltransferase